MLKRLNISQFVIIDNLSVDFENGLTVLTGETGAGKSILLGALGLILGDDPNRDAIRQGADESVIEAFFNLPPEHPVWAFLAQHEGMTAVAPDLQVRRTIGRMGKDEIFVAGTSVDLDFLKEMGPHLVEIHGQFANQNFLAPETQLFLLDAFGDYAPGIMENVAAAWADIGRLTRELEEERSFLATADREKNGIESVLASIEHLGLKKDLYAKLTAEYNLLTNSRDICDIFQSINAQLVAQSGVELALVRVKRSLDSQPDPALDVMKECIGTALDKTRIAITEMQILAPKYLNIDTSNLRTVETKLNDIRAIATERKVKPEELFDHYAYLSTRLARIRHAPAKIKELDEEIIKANETYRHHAHLLSEARQEAALNLNAAINAEMPPLKLMSAQVRIEVMENTAKRTARGFNEVYFTARMNPGMPFSPIAKTASGGELARLILAIKMILQQVQAVATLVFDEVDTGIGGAAAAAVGSRIAKLADTTQILVITHSPQVASRGTQHLHVSKQTDGTSTRTIVESLTIDQRINEVSRMLAGEEITDESFAAAKTLIEEAINAAAIRKAKGQEPPPEPEEEQTEEKQVPEAPVTDAMPTETAEPA